MSLVEHAKRELEKCGQYKEDPAYAQSIIAAVAAFASYGHSGGSAGIAIEQLHTLLQFRTLSPITSDPDEWIDQSPISSTPLWQNMRDSAAMSRDGGKTWYFVDERKSNEDEVTALNEINKLADFIIGEIPGEPSKSESAVDTAIRLLGDYLQLLVVSGLELKERANNER